MDSNVRRLAEVAHGIVNRSELADFAPYLLILLSRPSPVQFYSALVRRGAKILEHVGNPAPLKPEDLKLLEEMQAMTSDDLESEKE